MKACELFNCMDRDFALDSFQRELSGIPHNELIKESFYEKFMGLMLDSTEEIEKVYTVNFPTEKVLDRIFQKNEKNCLIFSHHGLLWEPGNKKSPLRPLDPGYYALMKQKKISLYILHRPLDKNGPYSTTVNFVKACGFEPVGEFCTFIDIRCGIIARATVPGCIQTKTGQIKNIIETTVGHRIGLWEYDDDIITGNRVCVVAGAVNFPFVLKLVHNLGYNTYITGTAKPVPAYPYTLEFHRLAEEYRINVLAATHYSTEKFACISLLDYFKSFNLECEFVKGEHDFADID